MIIFLIENQAVWKCQTLPTGDDPPVWISKGDRDDGDQAVAGERPICDSLSRFLTTYVLQELIFWSRTWAADDSLNRRFQAERDQATLVWSPGPYVRGEQSTFLWNDVLVMSSAGDAWFGANHDSAIEFLRVNQAPITGLTLARSPWALLAGSNGWGAVHRRTRGTGTTGRSRLAIQSAEVPAGTLDWPMLLDQVQTTLVASGGGLDNQRVNVTFSRQGNSGHDEPHSLADPALATEWFRCVLSLAGVAGTTLEPLLEQE